MTVSTTDHNAFLLVSLAMRPRPLIAVVIPLVSEDITDLEIERRAKIERRARQAFIGKHSRHMRRIVHQARRHCLYRSVSKHS